MTKSGKINMNLNMEIQIVLSDCSSEIKIFYCNENFLITTSLSQKAHNHAYQQKLLELYNRNLKFLALFFLYFLLPFDIIS